MPRKKAKQSPRVPKEKTRTVYVKTTPRGKRVESLKEPENHTRIDGNQNATGNVEEMNFEQVVANLSSRRWRLNNLYNIIDQDGRSVRFHMNEVQQDLYDNRWYLNIIPKARQHGITTFVDIMALDKALFEPNSSCAIVAHTQNDARRIFEEKVQYPYEHLPEALKLIRKAKRDTVNHLKFPNNSSIRVDAAGRSGTFGFLHISEFGKICCDFPEKAREIVTGSLNTVHQGNVIFIESTSAGAEGYFYEFCKKAYDKHLSGTPLTEMDYRLHFFPWWKKQSYRIAPEGVIIYPYLQEYFEKLRHKHGIELDDSQKAWYAKKIEVQGNDMWREFPSVFEEMFLVSADGAYYTNQFTKMRRDGRIATVPYMDGYLVDTFWDIGMDDYTAIWFTQTVGREVHVINYYENNGEGIPHYVDHLNKLRQELGYRYGKHIGPHDLRVRELSSRDAESRWQTFYNLGVRMEIANNIPVIDGIEAVRQFLDLCWFDEEKCGKGIIHLEQYRRGWDAKNGIWKDSPSKAGNHSHGADALRYGAVSWRGTVARSNRAPVTTRRVSSRAWS